MHAHTIAFSEAVPAWMQDLPTGTEQQRRASADALLGYLTTVVTHFRGRLASLDVRQRALRRPTRAPASRRTSGSGPSGGLPRGRLPSRPRRRPRRPAVHQRERRRRAGGPARTPAGAGAAHERAGRVRRRGRAAGPRLRPRHRRHHHRGLSPTRSPPSTTPGSSSASPRTTSPTPRRGRPGRAVRDGAGHLPGVAHLHLLDDLGRGRPLRLVRRRRRPAAGP